MARQFEGFPFTSPRADASDFGGRIAATAPGTISFVRKLAASESFKTLFKEGMALVEESAGYLDGAGREESRGLRRAAALAYATESMRLTTRLMQLASWLLLQRAVNEGDMSPAQAASEKHKVRLPRQGVACARELFDELPERLRELSAKSLRLQARIIHLDQSLSAEPARETVGPSPIACQIERLRMAFGAH
jgi:regulator of CtrA degradation